MYKKQKVKKLEHKYFDNERKEMLKYVPMNIKTAIEIGCGEGNFGISVKKLIPDCEFWGLEYDNIHGNIAKQKLDNVIIGDIQNNLYKLPDNYFNCIIFNDCLEHIADPLVLLKDLKGKLSKNGCIITSIPNVRYITNLINLLFKKDWHYKPDGVILDSTHLRFFTKKSIYRMFNEAGYTIEINEYINPMKSIRFFLLNLIFFGLISDTKYLQIATVARLK